jgi:hypothetical protein
MSDFRYEIKETSLPCYLTWKHWLKNPGSSVRKRNETTNNEQLILVLVDPVDDEDVEEFTNWSSNSDKWSKETEEY